MSAVTQSEDTPMRRTTQRRTPLVIIAEDDDDVRLALTATLADDGFRVHAVSDGERLAEHLEHCRQRGILPDVVLTDHRMPGYSGVEIIEGMQQAGMHVPVIMLTAFGAEVRAVAKAHGALAVFDKPFDIDDLRTAVFWAVDWRTRQLIRPRFEPAEDVPKRSIKELARNGGLF